MTVVFDAVLVLLVLALTLRMLTSREPFEAVVLFVAFGLAMALVWVRAGAVDVALAEIALGAGVTGALLVNTVGRLRAKAPEWLELPEPSASRAAVPVACGALAAAAAFAATRFAPAAEPLGPRIAARVAETPVSHPVTAVLLDFRAYDTLLEIAVLFGGLVSVWAVERGRAAVPPPATPAREPVLAALVGWIVPLAVIAAVYLTWMGSHGPGGAFQAGALLAGAGVLLLAAGFAQPYRSDSAAMRLFAAAGLLTFAGAALYTAVAGGAMLRYPAGAGYWWILGIEAVLTVSIAAILAEQFADVPAGPSAAGEDA
jgi:multisubunit Na+/H+ antiporter MnhB subunit